MKGDSLENDVLDSLCQTIQARLEKATSRVVVGHFLRLISHLGSFIQPNQVIFGGKNWFCMHIWL